MMHPLLWLAVADNTDYELEFARRSAQRGAVHLQHKVFDLGEYHLFFDFVYEPTRAFPSTFRQLLKMTGRCMRNKNQQLMMRGQFGRVSMCHVRSGFGFMIFRDHIVHIKAWTFGQKV